MSERVVITLADLQTALRVRIRDLGLTQEKVDDLAGLAAGHTGKILTGRKEPRFTTIARLCRALGLKNLFVPVCDGPPLTDNVELEARPEGDRRSLVRLSDSGRELLEAPVSKRSKPTASPARE
jgi:transcriptional regulator with XRE-family HTH domain